MNVDEMLNALNSEQVDYSLIGGMNFLIRHLPELTFDVDIRVRDAGDNLERLNRSLKQLGAAWGLTEKDWASVPEDWRRLLRQPVYCLTTQHGALDVFRDVRGLEGHYSECKQRGIATQTAAGVAFVDLSDEDMLACQEALPPEQQKPRRMEVLREAIRRSRKS